MKKQLFLLLLCFCFFSCKKKHTLKVTAVNKITDEAVANANVYIIEETNKVESMGGGTITHDFYNGYTDSEGILYITKRFDRRYNYKVWCQTFDKTGTKLLYSYYMNGGDKESAWKNGITFEVIPQAYLKQDIVNVNCEGSTDTFSIRDKYTYTDWTGWTSLAGCFSNTGGGYAKVPAGTRIFQWKVVRTSGTTTGEDTVIFSEGSYETLMIHY